MAQVRLYPGSGTRADVQALLSTSNIHVNEFPRGQAPVWRGVPNGRRWDGRVESLTDDERQAQLDQRLLLLWGPRPDVKRIGLIIQFFPRSVLVAPPVPNYTNPQELVRRISVGVGGENDPGTRWLGIIMIPDGCFVPARSGPTRHAYIHMERGYSSRYNAAIQFGLQVSPKLVSTTTIPVGLVSTSFLTSLAASMLQAWAENHLTPSSQLRLLIPGWLYNARRLNNF